MSKFIDMTGWIMSEHGVPDSKLTVLYRADNSKTGGTMWLCECSCKEHKQFVAFGGNIRKGRVKSCGCVNSVQAAINGMVNKKFNQYILNLEDEHGPYGIGYCTNTGNKFYFDMDDYEKIKQYCWFEQVHPKTGYHTLETHEPKTHKRISMHWLTAAKYYDHIDRNPLNNRKSNLRPADRFENARNSNKQKNNTSGFTGVYQIKDRSKWRAEITVNHKVISLGCFVEKEDAVKARLLAEVKYFGEFAPQRHLFEKYEIVDKG